MPASDSQYANANRTVARRRGWRRALGVGATLLVCAFLVAGVATNWAEVSRYDWSISPLWLVTGALLVWAHLLMAAAAYIALIERFSGVHQRRLSLLVAWGKSLLARYVPGSVLMFASRVVLSRDAGVAAPIAATSAFYEQVLALGVAGVASTAFLILYGLGDGAGLVWFVIAAPLALIVLLPGVFGRLSGWLLRRLGRDPIERSLQSRTLLGFMVFIATAMVVLGVGVWALINGLIADPSGGPLFVMLAFLLAFTVSTLAVVFPAGLGVREGILALAFTEVMPLGVGIAVAASLRVCLILLEVGFVGAAIVIRRWVEGPSSASSGGTAISRASAPEA